MLTWVIDGIGDAWESSSAWYDRWLCVTIWSDPQIIAFSRLSSFTESWTDSTSFAVSLSWIFKIVALLEGHAYLVSLFSWLHERALIASIELGHQIFEILHTHAIIFSIISSDTRAAKSTSCGYT